MARLHQLTPNLGNFFESFVFFCFFNLFNPYARPYFWRTQSQKGIDYIEDLDGHISAFELKWNVNVKTKEPAEFLRSYPNSSFRVITPDNYLPFILQ